MNKIDEYKSKINYDVWEDIYNTEGDKMREDRTSYIVRKMQEGRMNTHPWEDLDEIRAENTILRNNVKELQGQLQNAYKRIAELSENKEQMELDFGEFYQKKGWKSSNA